MKAQRFDCNPILRPHMDARMGDNINGPCLVRVPDWLPDPLGRYYLYFAHHQGDYIRLAYSDELRGPWQTYEPGTLQLRDSLYEHHIASPDIYVDNDARQFRMYYHGASRGQGQSERVARSTNGIDFEPLPQVLGGPYWRVFPWDGLLYALGMPGRLYRSVDGLTDFEEGPTLFTADMRHSAVRLKGDILQVFYSNAYDCPERILLSEVPLSGNWTTWRATAPVTLLEPEEPYEGADLPLGPSKRGWIPTRARQLRDPGIFEEDGRLYLLYSVAGEHGIAIAELWQ